MRNQKLENIIIISIVLFSACACSVGLIQENSVLIVISLINVVLGSIILLDAYKRTYKPSKPFVNTKASPRCKNVLKVNLKRFL